MSSTVIDSLVLELGLDPRKFKSGQTEVSDLLKKLREDSEQSGKAVESQGHKVSEYFDVMKRQAVGMLGVFLGGRGIKEFTSYVTGLDAAVGRLAPQFNLSTKEMSAWQGAMEQTGGSANSATQTLGGLTSEMNKFLLTGQSSMLPILNSLGIGLYDSNKNLKTSAELLLEISDIVKGMDPARAAAVLSMIPGMNQDSINLLIQGRKAVEGYLETARKAGGTTRESAEAAAEYQKQLALLDRSATDLGRSILGAFLPALIAVSEALRKITTGMKEGTLGKPVYSESHGLWSDIKRVILERAMRGFARATGNDDEKSMREIDRFLGLDQPVVKPPAPPAAAPSPAAGSGAFTSKMEKEAFIRTEAVKRGIDPDIAVRVAKSEGFNTYEGDHDATGKPTSFGSFQLHYPGIGRHTADGLGTKFTKQTGLDARDPATEREQIKFALDEAKKGGWGPWHGWRGLPNAGIGAAPTAVGAGEAGGGLGRQSSNQTTTVTVGKIEITSNSADPAAVAAEIPEAMRRINFAASANYGLQG